MCLSFDTAPFCFIRLYNTLIIQWVIQEVIFLFHSIPSHFCSIYLHANRFIYIFVTKNLFNLIYSST